MERAQAQRVAGELQLVRSASLSNARFHGLSMLPLLREGDRVVVQSVVWQQIRRGDVITYRCADKYPTRRVVGKPYCRLQALCRECMVHVFAILRTIPK